MVLRGLPYFTEQAKKLVAEALAICVYKSDLQDDILSWILSLRTSSQYNPFQMNVIGMSSTSQFLQTEGCW